MDPGLTKPRARHPTNVCVLLAGRGSWGRRNGGSAEGGTHAPARAAAFLGRGPCSLTRGGDRQ